MDEWEEIDDKPAVGRTVKVKFEGGATGYGIRLSGPSERGVRGDWIAKAEPGTPESRIGHVSAWADAAFIPDWV